MNFTHINYSMLPEHMQEVARLYLEHRIPPGSFMTAVLENDFIGAVGKADQINIHFLKNWAQWVYSECPALAWGSPAKVTAWLSETGEV